MTVNKYHLSLILLVAITFHPLKASNYTNCRDLINSMLNSISEVKNARYTLHSSERVKGKINSALSVIKIEMKPRKIYFKNNSGIEVLYNEVVSTDALVNPNAFPYINLWLDPYRSIMRNNQHHSIFELGFQHMGSIIEEAMDKSGSNFEKWFTYMGIIKYNNRDCHKIFFEYPEFKYVNYIVLKNENVRTIAKKLGVGEYRILQHNTNISYTDNIKEGRVLSLPNVYASKTLIYIDKELNLPVYIKAFDDHGFYEAYEFSDLKINVQFAPKEFDKSFSEYNF